MVWSALESGFKQEDVSLNSAWLDLVV